MPALKAACVCAAVWLAACFGPAFGGGRQDPQLIATMNQGAEARMGAAQRLQRREVYVIAESLWLCPSAKDVAANRPCSEGRELAHNQWLRVIGSPEGPRDAQVWRAEIPEADGLRSGFVRAGGVAERPDLRRLLTYLKSLDARVPPRKRLDWRSVDLASLLAKPRAYRGRLLVMPIPVSSTRDTQVTTSVLRFTVAVAKARGSQVKGNVLFELTSRQYAHEIKSGDKVMRCNASYCDSYFVIARYRGEIRDVPGPDGTIERLPVFEITELADRFSVYEAD